MTMDTDTRVKVEFWSRNSDEAEIAYLEAVRDEYDAGRVAIHTFVNGAGSETSFYLDREAAIVFARNILAAVALDHA